MRPCTSPKTIACRTDIGRAILGMPREDRLELAPVQAPRRKRAVVALALVATAVAVLVIPQAAMAADGVGTGGRTTDKSVTFFCFGVIALFMVLPIVLTLIQSRLEGRKERMREQIERVRRS